MKTRFKLLFLMNLAILSVCATTWDGITKTAWTVVAGVNDGTSLNKPLLIQTPENLAKLAELVNAGNSYSGVYFRLNADLDLGSHNWTCIGDAAHPFSGNFDGNWHKIANLSITKWTNYIGLFGAISSASISNLGIESGSIVFGGSYAGSIVGQASGTASKYSYITGCYNKANLVKGATDPRVYLGGIAGLLLNYSKIIACYNTGNITNNGNAASSNTGGIVGATASGSSVLNCYSAGNIVGNNIKGGIVGSSWGTVANSYFDFQMCTGANAALKAIGSNATPAKVGAWYFGGWSFPADANGYTYHISPTLVSTFSEREPLWGWREDPKGVMAQQIDFAANSGLSYWGFCWYDTALVSNPKLMDNLNNALNSFLVSPNRNRLEFCLLSCFPVSRATWGKLCDRTIQYFLQPNYLRVNGKPVMVFFNSDDVITGLGGIDSTVVYLNRYRQKARDLGLGEILIGARTKPRIYEPTYQNKYAQCGFDFLTTYQNANEGRVTAGANDYANLIAGDQYSWNGISSYTTLPYIPTVGAGYDMRPWATDHPTQPASDFWYTGLTPDRIGTHFRQGVDWVKNNPSKTLGNLLVSYAWNENGEGGWLNPTKAEGTARLDAVSRAIAYETSDVKGLKTSEMKDSTFVGLLNADGNLWKVNAANYPILSCWDGVTKTMWKSVAGVNDGTSINKPYLIQSPEHLAKLAELVNGGNAYSGTFFRMVADIDLGNHNWTCIGDATHPFSGNFDGNWHKITNLSITKWSNFMGLFGAISSGTIKNTGIESGLITCGGSYAGGIVGQASGTTSAQSYIHCCYNKANLVKGATDPRVYLGGIAGLLLSNTKLDFCYNQGNITNDGNAGSSNSGGIVGAIAGSSSVLNSYSTGIVVGNNVKGGVLGSNWASISNTYYNTDLCVGTNAATQAIGSSANTANVKGKTTLEMKDSTFVALLNAGDSLWKAVVSDYPTLSGTSIPTFRSVISSAMFENNSLRVYVNQHYVNVREAPMNTDYQVTDYMGRSIRHGKIDTSSFRFELPNSGIYIIRVASKTLKFIIK
ncbi:MAG: glycoside hydrolase family 99-like domain-containing protein [Bacteroidales bacterium]|nr:glycoside hydrolase family 99-like domain-containing protein [Bacteroidales bacterium]